MTPNPLRSRTNLSIFIGLWLGLTAMVGVCAFGVIFWLLSRNAAPAATATPQPIVATQPPAATLTPPPVPEVTALPTAALAEGGPACNCRP